MIYWPYEMKRLVITGVRTGKIIRAIMPKLVIFEVSISFLPNSIPLLAVLHLKGKSEVGLINARKQTF